MWWEVVSAVVQVFGFAGVVWALLENRRALQAQVALEFYRRYAEVAARMPNELRFATYADGAWDRMPDETRTKAALAMIEYLNLSSEEYGLCRKRRLPRDVWRVTSAEIARYFKSRLWQDGWQVIRNEYASDKRFMDYVDRLVARNGGVGHGVSATAK
jgi:hypothetical protein